MAAGERVIAAAPFAGGGSRVLISPFQFTTSGEDNLRVVSANSASGVRIRIQGRWFDTKGNLQVLSEVHTPNTDRSVKTQNYPLGPGALTNLTVFAEAGTPLWGQTYVLVELIRGLTGGITVLGTLLGGYVTTTQALGWPGSPIVSSTDGEPAPRFITGTDPPAGFNFLETVPTGARWELLTFYGLFTSSAAAGNRETDFAYGNASSQQVIVVPQGVVPPSTSYQMSWAPGLVRAVGNVNFIQNIAIPHRAILIAADTIRSLMALDVNDQWTQIRYFVREWLEVL